MTNDAATDVRQWLVSARSRGELLATSARAPGLELVMVGVPAGYSAEEVESWLRDLMAMSLETSRAEAGDRPIPSLLHHLLTGLIFSHSELWDRGGGTAPTSMAFVRTPREVAFGWVGGPAPDLWIDDHPVQVEWVRVRDQDGREGCALAIDPVHRVRVHFGFAAAGVAQASVDGVWVPDADPNAAHEIPGATAETTDPRHPSTIARAVGARASAPPSPPMISPGPSEVAPASLPMPELPRPADREGWTVVYESDATPGSAPPAPSRSWWSGVTEWIGGGRKSSARGTEPDAALGVPERIPPSPEPAELTARAAPTVDLRVHAGLAEIELAPLAPEEPAHEPASALPAAEPGDLHVESVHLDEPPVRRPSPRIAPTAVAATPPAPAEVTPPSGRAPQNVPGPSPPANVAPPPAAQSPAPPARVAAPPAPPVEARAPLAPDAIEDGVIATVPATAPRPMRRVPRSLDWTESSQAAADRPWWAKPWIWAIAVIALFFVGWLLGGQSDRSSDEPGLAARMLRAVGLGGARFDARVTSDPAGAWITVDGKDVARRTPATLDLAAGIHQVTLTLPDLGSATYEVRGVRGDHGTLDAHLAGSLAVYAGDGGIPVAVSVDGTARGLAPVTVEALTPGTHDVRFSGPGLQPWGQTVQVKVNETAQMTARAVTSPATGVLETRATWTDTEGSEELTGATVTIDGEKRGVTPLTLELPRGPHSVRIESRGEKSQVQVIDLPGGNQRFANFELGLGIEHPTLAVLGTPLRVPIDQPTVLSAALQGLHASEAREMWLNVQQPDGAWRRYPMVMMNATGGVVGTSVFPSTLFDSQGHTRFYVSASNQTGDDFFSEMETATVAVPPPAAKK